MDTLTLEKMDASHDAIFFDLFAAVRAGELGMDAWDPEERARMLRFQFEAQRRGYRARYPRADETLILLDGTPIGWLIVDRSGPAIRCVDIALTGESRGRGVGTRVVRALQEEAAGAGRPLELTVLRTNLRAAALYARLGFRVAGGTDLHDLMEWRRQPDFSEPATCREHLGSTFRVDHDAGPVELRLVTVESERVAGGFGQFSIFFHGPADRALPEAIHSFQHDALGQFALFIVPVIGSNDERIVYQACFSRAAPRNAANPDLTPRDVRNAAFPDLTPRG